MASFEVDENEFVSLFDSEEVACVEFGMSPKISVYLYSIIAGPYVTFESQNEDIKSYKVPLKIYSRKSIAKYVESAKEDYFNVTKSGIEFYSEFFKTPYPFEKLD